MNHIELHSKACRYAEFLIYHLGIEHASAYINTMLGFIYSKIEVFKKLSQESSDDFNSIKNLKNG